MTNVIPLSPFGRKPVVIVAGGPSLTLAQTRIVGMARAQDQCRVIAVNDAIYPCWFADIAYAGDERWWRKHKGVPRCPSMKLAIQNTQFKDVRTLRDGGRVHLENDDAIGNWRNSGAQAVQLAAKLLARRIILLGFDYSGSKEEGTGTRDHWFGRHERGMDINSDVEEIKRLFRVLTEHLAKRQVAVVNCSPGSAIDWLPVSTIEQEFSSVI